MSFIFIIIFVAVVVLIGFSLMSFIVKYYKIAIMAILSLFIIIPLCVAFPFTIFVLIALAYFAFKNKKEVIEHIKESMKDK